MATEQTAVEWLYDRIIIFPKTIDDLAHNARSFKKAQKMHEKQIKDAWLYGQDDGATICTPNQQEPEKQYYNETYNKKEDGTI